MSFTVSRSIVGRDNAASGSVKGRENMAAGVEYPVPFREACYLGASVSTTLSRSSTIVTASATAHGLSVGNIVQIMGADQTGYNGEWEVQTVADANTFTYFVYSAPTASATGTITSKKVLQGSTGR